MGGVADGSRMRALDGLRGLAALSVVIAHLWEALPMSWHHPGSTNWVEYPPLAFLLNDRGAVVLFYMLSGYVLALSLARAGWPGSGVYVPFVLRRLCRIWLPFATVLIVSFGLASLFGRTYWSLDDLGEPPTLHTLFMQLSLRYRLPPLDIPTWTLVVELKVAAVFPLLVTLMRAAPVPTMLSALILNMLPVLGDVQLFPSLIFFAAGAWLAQPPGWIAGFRGVILRWPGICAIMAIFALGLPLGHFYTETIMAVGALVLMVLALAHRGTAYFLLGPAVQALGRVSFALYLTHIPVAHAMMAVFAGVAPVPVILLLSLPMIAVVTVVTFVVVERPAMRLGAWSVIWLNRRPAASAATNAAPPG
jgi:peptidoglycan/LPS O-acetylase OafA/YrhL